MILSDKDPMPHGEYAGTKMANVPADYLLWHSRLDAPEETE